MVEKHLNRISNASEQDRGDSEEDWSHITGVGSRIEIVDPLAVTDRTIIFGKDVPPLLRGQGVKEKTDQFRDQMSNTNQYLKFVNAHLAEKKVQLDRIKEREKKFQEEIDALQGNSVKPRSELDKVNYKYITENDTKSLIIHIESEIEQIKEKLIHRESQMEKIRSELQQKEEHLKYLQEEIAQKNKKNAAPEDPLLIIREELAKMGINGNSGKLASALSALSGMVSKGQSHSQTTS